MDIYSNAFNFASHQDGQVDLRTGQYSRTIQLATLRPLGPVQASRDIQLTFSMLAAGDEGYGAGWRLAVSRYDIAQRLLTLASGEVHRVTALPEVGQPLPIPDLKLRNIRVLRSGGDAISILYMDGSVELLRRSGDRYRTASLTFENGEVFDFSYTGFGALAGVRSAVLDREVLTLEYRSGALSRSRALTQGGRIAEIAFTRSNSFLTSVTLPFDNTDGRADPAAQPRFAYGYRTLASGLVGVTRVDNPHGGVDLVQYDEQALRYFGQTFLPAAVRLLRNPGAGQPEVTIRYSYSRDVNFTGFPFPGGFEAGTDNLYRVVGDYSYWGEQTISDPDNGDQVIERIRADFNRFHLMTRRVTQRGAARVTEAFAYNEIAGRTFLDQPANLQLPRRVATTFQADGRDDSRTETVTVESDVYGNTLANTQASGVRTEYEYYPAEGAEEDCPADPSGYFVRFPRLERVLPANAEAGETPRTTAITYAGLRRLSGEGYFVLERSRTTGAGVASLDEPVDDPSRPMVHGRPASSRITVGGTASVTAFSYAVDGLDLDERRTTTGHDGAQTWARRTVCALTRQLVRAEAAGEPTVVFAYDVAGRLTAQTVAPETDKAASHTYAYHFAAGVRLEETDAQGLTYVTRYDGLGRLVSAAQKLGEAAERRIKALAYDRLGRKAAETVYDQLDGQELALTSRYAYGGWGELDRTVRPDGSVALSVRDMVADTLTTGTEGLDRTVSRYNGFRKVDQATRISSRGQEVLTLQRRYDGFGRCISATDVDGHQTDFDYDALDRVTAIRMRPADATPPRTIETRYAPFSSAELPVEVAVDGVVLGRRAYDGLGRLVLSANGEAAGTTYSYQGGDTRPSGVVSARGVRLTYDYSVALGGVEGVTGSGGEARSYQLDPVSGLVERSVNPQAERRIGYDSYQSVTFESLKAGDRQWETSYRSSPAGRQLQRSGSEGPPTSFRYDAAGRPLALAAGPYDQTMGYDAFGRLDAVRVSQSGVALETAIGFDDFGREAVRTLSAGEAGLQAIHKRYDNRDRLTERRALDGDGALASLERFTYDAYGRLVAFASEGPHHPANGAGRAVAGQAFAYDALDNIVQVATRYADGGEDVAIRRFDGPVPTQLTAVESSDPAACRRLTWDADGNLLSDGAGASFAYDDFGRLSHASRGGDYGYDAEGRLIAQTPPDAPTLHRLHSLDRPAVEAQGETVAELRDDGAAVRGAAIRGPGGAQASLYGLDTSGSVVASLGADGPTGPRLYLPYGESPFAGDTPPGQLAGHPAVGFNGQRLDVLTGLYHLGEGRRAYSPELMIFLSPDPLAVFGAGGLNPYAYCSGDPINFADPSGLWREEFNVGLSTVGLVLALVILGVAIAGIASTGVGAVAVLGLAGAISGVISSVLGVASAGVELDDKRHGWDRSKDAANLNIASLSFGLLSLALGAIGAGAAARETGRQFARGNLFQTASEVRWIKARAFFENFMGVAFERLQQVNRVKSVFGVTNVLLGFGVNTLSGISLHQYIHGKVQSPAMLEAETARSAQGTFEPVLPPPQDAVGGLRRFSADFQTVTQRARGSVNSELYRLD